MKNIFLFLLLASGVIFAGCYKDNSNTDLKNAEVITIEGIETNYNVTAFSELLTIDPVVTSNKDADWEYSWGVYETNVQGYAPVLDTLNHTRQLSMVFDLTPKTWILVFSAKNKLTGYQVMANANLNLVTQYTAGWLVLKDDGVNTDADIFPIKNSVAAENPTMSPESFTPIENIISLMNEGRNMHGKGVKISVATAWRVLDPSSNSMINTRVYVFASENDFLVTRASNMEIVRDVSNVSYDPWTTVNSNFYYTGSTALVAGLNGKLYAINTMSGNTGKFGIYKTLSSDNPDYYLSDYVCINFMATILFDEVTSSFISAGYYGDITYAQKTNDGTPEGTSEIEPQHNNLTCLYMGYSVNRGYGVFADKTTGKRQILSFVPGTSLNIRIQSEVEAADKAHDATMFTVMNDEFVMYFVGADGNVYSRLLTGTSEQLEFEVPAGETVTFLRNHRSYYAAGYIPSQVAIATSKGSGASATYHIRFFSKVGGHIDELEMELQGNGYARDYMTAFSGTASASSIFYSDRYL